MRVELNLGDFNGVELNGIVVELMTFEEKTANCLRLLACRVAKEF